MPNKNPYKFGEGESGENNQNPPSNSNGLNMPIDKLKDLGGIPLPKNEDMGKWIIVISVIVLIGTLFFIGSWVNSEMQFKNQQIQDCNNNFQDLNVKYILKDQELKQIKNEQIQSIP